MSAPEPHRSGPSHESLEAQRLATLAVARREQGERSAHRLTIGLGGLVAVLMGTVCFAMRHVAADPAKGIPAHEDTTMTLGAYALWGLAVIMFLGVAGFLNIGTQASLAKHMQKEGLLPEGPDTRTVHVHHHHYPSASSATPPTPEGEPPPITRWTD